MTDPLAELYEIIKSEATLNISSTATGKAIHDLAINTLRFLKSAAIRRECKSLVPGKQYFIYSQHGAPGIVCRPANEALFNTDPDTVSAQWQAWWEGRLSHADLAKMAYTITLAPCLAMELFDRQNKK